MADKISVTGEQVREDPCPVCDAPANSYCVDAQGRTRRKNGMPCNHIARVLRRRARAPHARSGF